MDSATKKRRLWPWLIATPVALLAVAVALIPTLLSTSRGAAFVAKQLDARLAGSVTLSGISLGWRGPQQLRGLTIRDSEGRTVLDVATISYAPSLWAAASSPLEFESLTIDRPRVAIYPTADGDTSLARALSPSDAQGPADDTSLVGLPKVKGHLVLRNAVISWPGLNDTRAQLTDGLVDVRLDTLNDVSGTARIAHAANEQITATFKLADWLSPEGALTVESLRGTVDVKTSAPLALSQLHSMAPDVLPEAGSLSFNINATRAAKGQTEARYDILVGGLPQPAGDAATPARKTFDLKLSGILTGTAERISGQTSLSGGASRVQASYDASLADIAALLRPVDRWLEAVLDGSGVALPPVKLAAKGQIDLAQLAPLLKPLFQRYLKAEVQAGSLELRTIDVSGGDQPKLGANIHLSGLVTRLPQAKPMPWKPLAIDLAARLIEKQGVYVDKAQLNSEFATITATGTAQQLSADLNVDLKQATDRVARLLGIRHRLTGELAGRIAIKREDEHAFELALETSLERIAWREGRRRVSLQRAKLVSNGPLRFVPGESKITARQQMVIDVTDLRERGGGKPLRLRAATLKQSARITFVSGQLSRVETPSLRLALGKGVSIRAQGWIEPQRGALDAQVESFTVDLAWLGRWLNELGNRSVKGYSGKMSGALVAKQTKRSEPLELDGHANVAKLTVRGQRVGNGEARLTWKDLRYQADGRVALAKLSLTSDPLQLEVKQIDASLGKTPTASGTFTATANLASLARATAPLRGDTKLPAIAGKLICRGKATSKGDTVALDSSAVLERLRVGRGKQTYSEARMEIDIDVTANSKSKQARLKRAALKSKSLSASLTGTVDDYARSQKLNLTGEYSAKWSALLALANVFSADATEDVRITGSSASPIRFSGPANTVGAKPSFKGLKGAFDVTWAQADLPSLRLGRAHLKPRLADGRLTLPPTRIPARDGGHVQIAGLVDFTLKNPQIQITRGTTVLEAVPVSAQLQRNMLTNFNPVLGQLAGVDGNVNLKLNSLSAPLGDQLQNKARAQGELDLSQLKVIPGGMVAEILRLTGRTVGKKLSVNVPKVPFTIADGKIHYDNFNLRFADGLQLGFSGAVGFDNKIDMAVSMPVSSGLLQRLGVSGPVAKYAQVLTGSQLRVPISGTRTHPKLRLEGVSTRQLVAQAKQKLIAQGRQKATSQLQKRLGKSKAGKTVQKGLGGVLGGLFGKKKKK